ncbi:MULTISPECIES: hypothetical protein [Micromonospora]|uniref:hypothetical protein n=1 Tax=Micromonospora sp. AMSO1212t TaxID=2650565 RepID=UPI000AC2B0EE|nr:MULTISPECIES: hypothetical protein [Micromonospora]MDX5458482.1 hypothetical protein [Micromonospora tulbaghiae]
MLAAHAVGHQAADLAVGATVTGVTPAGVTPSFHAAGIADARHHVTVLRHVTVPFIATGHRRGGAVQLLGLTIRGQVASLCGRLSVRPLDASLRERRLVEAEELLCLSDGVVQVVEGLSVSRILTEHASCFGELRPEGGKRIALHVKAGEGPTCQLHDCPVATTGQDLRLLLAHPSRIQ